MQKGLEVGACGQGALEAEFIGQLKIVIDLAIADHRRACSMQRLPAALQINDRQAGVCEGNAGQILHPDAVRTAMLERVDQSAGRDRPVQDAGYAAHQRAPRSENRSRH